MRVRYMRESTDILEDSAYVIDHPEELRGSWTKLLQTEHLALEVGCGLGNFLTRMAKQSVEGGILSAQGDLKDYGWVGLERIGTILAKASQRVERFLAEENNAGKQPEEVAKESAPQLPLRFIRGDAHFLTDYFAEGEVDRIYLNFSDPWPKKHHAKRRLTSEVFLPVYSRLLKKDGILQMKTDNDDLFAYSLLSLQKNGWEILHQSTDLHNSEYVRGNVMTEYEQKFSSRGKNINFLQARPEAVHSQLQEAQN